MGSIATVLALNNYFDISLRQDEDELLLEGDDKAVPLLGPDGGAVSAKSVGSVATASSSSLQIRSRGLPGMGSSSRSIGGASARSSVRGSTSSQRSARPSFGRFFSKSIAQSRHSRNFVTETSFLTKVVEQLWPYLKVALGQTIREAVDPCFEALPPPLKTLHFTKVDLGNVPIRMDNIVVHPLTPDGSVQCDIDILWDGDCDLQLKADYLGKLGVRKLKIWGRMAVIFNPLSTELPSISGIQYSFINPPEVDLSFTGLASLADVSLLERTVKGALQSALSVIVTPNRNLYKLMTKNNYLDTYIPPIGIVRVKANCGKGFVIEKRRFARDDIPDVYLNVTVGLSDVWKTSTIQDDCNPVWNERGDFLLWDREQVIKIEAWDRDGGPLDPDDYLGTCEIVVADLVDTPGGSLDVPLMVRNKKTQMDDDTGASLNIACDILPLSAQDMTSLKSPPIRKRELSPTPTRRGFGIRRRKSKKAAEVGDRTLYGMLVIIINRAFNLPLDRKKAMTHVKVTYDTKEYLSTMIYDYEGWDSLNPIYDSAFTIPLKAPIQHLNGKEVTKAQQYVTLELIQNEGKKPKVLGTLKIQLNELDQAANHTITEKRPIGKKGASLEFRIGLCGVLKKQPQDAKMTNGSTSSMSNGGSMSRIAEQ